MTIIVLSNRMQGMSQFAPTIGRALQRIAFGEMLAMPPAREPRPLPMPRACHGTFQLSADNVLRVSEGQAGVRLEPHGLDALLAVNGVVVDRAVRDSLGVRALRTTSLLESAWGGDAKLLTQVAAPARAERYRLALVDWRRQRADSLGALVRITILGSLPSPAAPGTWLTYADLTFARGNERIALGWSQAGELIHLATENPALAEWSERFVATVGGGYSAHDLISETTVSARCHADESGARWELMSGTSRWVAKRTP